MLHSETFNAFLVTSISLTVVATLLSRAKIPTIVGFILTGVLIGPSGLNWIRSLPAANTISELGIVFLMFSLGLEISLEHLRGMIRPLLRLGFLQVSTTILLALGIFYLGFGFPAGKSFVLGACIALSSTALILKLLQDKRETETPHGRVSITVLLFQDIVALPLMVSIPLLAATSTASSTQGSLLMAMFWILVFLVGCFLVGYYLIPRLFAEVLKTGSREVFFLMILSLTFVISFLAEQVGLSMSLGAFVAGVLISESPYNKQALAELAPLRDIFLGFFFASVGMLVNIDFIISHIHNLLWLIPLMFLLKFMVIYLVVKWNSHSHGVSFASALALTQIGEFSFILGASALSHKLISDLEFQYFLALAVFSLLFTPLMFSCAIKSSAHNSWPELTRALSKTFIKRRGKQNGDGTIVDENKISSPLPLGQKDLVVAPRRAIVIGLGHAGINILEELTQNGIPCTGVDFNMNHVNTVRSKGISAIYGDATRVEVLESAGIRDSYVVLITVSGKQLTSQILAVVHHLCPRVKVIVRVQYILELKDLPSRESDEIVVSEKEATHALIKKALAEYSML